MNEDILVSSHGRVAVITLNRPASLNAWTTAMREMIIDALQRFDADSDVAAIVMTGAG
ncbi:enoyl-CoA hydratase-related protein, partial [Burkholderia sp. SIMBA_057]